MKMNIINMKKELIIALVIIVIAASVSYTGLTGLMVRDWQLFKTRDAPDVTEVNVLPHQIKVGEAIDIYIDPGKSGARDSLGIYRVGALGRLERVAGAHRSAEGGAGINWCGVNAVCLEKSEYDCTRSFKCHGKRMLRWKTYGNWEPGKYSVAVYDFSIEDWVYGGFEIIE